MPDDTPAQINSKRTPSDAKDLEYDPKRYVVWVCNGCDWCEPLDGSERDPTPCTGSSPSMDGKLVVLAVDYDRLAATITPGELPSDRDVIAQVGYRMTEEQKREAVAFFSRFAVGPELTLDWRIVVTWKDGSTAAYDCRDELAVDKQMVGFRNMEDSPSAPRSVLVQRRAVTGWEAWDWPRPEGGA